MLKENPLGGRWRYGLSGLELCGGPSPSFLKDRVMRSFRASTFLAAGIGFLVFAVRARGGDPCSPPCSPPVECIQAPPPRVCVEVPPPEVVFRQHLSSQWSPVYGEFGQSNWMLHFQGVQVLQ